MSHCNDKDDRNGSSTRTRHEYGLPLACPTHSVDNARTRQTSTHARFRLVVQDIHNSSSSSSSTSAAVGASSLPAHVQREAPTHSMAHLPAHCTRDHACTHLLSFPPPSPPCWVLLRCSPVVQSHLCFSPVALLEHTHTHTHTHTHIHIHIHTRTYVHTCIPTRTRTCPCINTRVHTRVSQGRPSSPPSCSRCSPARRSHCSNTHSTHTSRPVCKCSSSRSFFFVFGICLSRASGFGFQ